ncbi:hypothetical protein EIH08_08060 [Chryseobacterium taklimakanense]|uniref:RHS repeat-associated core domain-containing protein n=2 Tax=Chryseobacterium taklimakanense TaxID=536441 RepID=A0A3G8WLH6_9FLAO|nr:hypothetical protein EIH08_08060 [Chryseobacterium taklimakanense]
MNGRLYDPLLRRFLNADENIQDMFNTQNYNKYGYVLNNPLMFNDPSGEFIPVMMGYALAAVAKAIFWAGVIKAAIIGAAIGLGSYLISSAVMGQKITVGGILKSIFFGAAGGAVTFGIGSIFTSSFGTLTTIGSTLDKAGILWLVKGGAHAVSQGLLSTVQGGNFMQSALSGALGSIGAGVFGAIAGDFANSTLGTVAFGALSGGIGSELAGGNFWQGALIGGMLAGLNHMATRMDTEVDYADGGKKGTGGASNDAQGDVLNWFNENDGGLYRVAKNDPGAPEGTVRVYTHGNQKGIAGPRGEWMTTPDQIDKVLMERSPTWRNYRENGGSVKLELMSCNTGRWGNGIASKISQAFRFSSVLAPNNYYVAYTRNGVSWGAVAGQYNLINPGRWNYFVNGQNLTSIYNRR